jgi:hypothetical protein
MGRMETIGTLNAQGCLKSAEPNERKPVCQSGVMTPPLGMAEIVRFFNEEKEARGWEAKGTPVAATKEYRAYELVESKLDAAEWYYKSASREAEARARAAYP